MPDPNKHAALAAAGFKILPVCSTCVHWGHTEGVWGRCSLTTYQHTKHDGVKMVGTPDIGSCDQHGPDGRAIEMAVGADYAARYST